MFPTGTFAPVFMLMAAAAHLGLALVVGLAGLGLAAILRPPSRTWGSVIWVGVAAALPGGMAVAVALGAAFFGPKMGHEAVLMEDVAFYSLFVVPAFGCVVGALGGALLRSPRP